MARPKKSTTEKVEQAVAPLKDIGVEPEEVDIKDAAAEPIKCNIIIAKTSVPFRRIPSLETKYIVSQMPVGIAYEIVRDVTSKIYGEFYQLNNGYYITKDGNYSIS